MLSYVPAGMKGNEDKGRAGASSWTLYNRERENINSVKLSYHQQLTHLSPPPPPPRTQNCFCLFISFFFPEQKATFSSPRLFCPPNEKWLVYRRTITEQTSDNFTPNNSIYVDTMLYLLGLHCVFIYFILYICLDRQLPPTPLIYFDPFFFFLTFSDCIHILILIPVSLCWVFGSCVRKQHPDVRTLLLYLYAFLFIFYLFSFLLCFWIVSNVFVYALAIHTHFTQQQLLYCVPTHRHCRPYSVVYTI